MKKFTRFVFKQMLNLNQIIKYIFSGFFINLFGYLLYVIFIKYLNFSAYISLLVSYLVSIIFYYFSQTFYVFKVKVNFNSFLKFLLNTISIFLLNIFLLFVLVQLLNYDELLSQLYIMFFLIILNFINQKKLIFINHKK